MNLTDNASRQKNYTQNQIETLLDKLGIKFKSIGQLSGYLEYTSLRAPRSSGIYYLVAGVTEPESITGSLILTDTVPAKAKLDNAYLVLANPQLAYYKLMQSCFPKRSDVGIHPTALVDPTANISNDAYVGPYCVVEANVSIESGCRLEPHIVVKSGSTIGQGTHIESHCTIGATGVAWVWDIGGHERTIQPQIGGVKIGKDVFIGSDVSIVRGSVNEMTEIGDNTVIAPGSKIGHGCRLGNYVHLANNVALGGNVDAGKKVFFGSGAVVKPHVKLAEGVVVGAGAVVIRDIVEPNTVVGGVPAKVLDQTGKKLAGVPAPPVE